jgi:hypothetical protein
MLGKALRHPGAPIGRRGALGEHVLVDKALRSPGLHERRLASLEPGLDTVTLLLTLVAPSGGLAVARRRTSAHALALLLGANIVAEATEDRSVARLDGQRRKQRG